MQVTDLNKKEFSGYQTLTKYSNHIEKILHESDSTSIFIQRLLASEHLEEVIQEQSGGDDTLLNIIARSFPEDFARLNRLKRRLTNV